MHNSQAESQVVNSNYIFYPFLSIICTSIFSYSYKLKILSGPAPDRGTEIYCYRIPRDCFEDELVPVFQSVGRLYELRLMIEFSGANRSYCYVRYCNSEDAKKAILMLNNYPIRKGYPLAVTRSVDNRKLCIKTVPPLGRNVSEKNVVEVNNAINYFFFKSKSFAFTLVGHLNTINWSVDYPET